MTKKHSETEQEGKPRKPDTMTDSAMRACHDHPCMEDDLNRGDIYLYGKRWLRGRDGWWTEVIE